MSMTLYDVALEGILIQEILGENDGELTPELEKRLDSLLIQGSEKIEAAAKVVKMLEATAEASSKESERLSDRAKSFSNQAKRLKDRMTVALDAAFSGRVRTPLFTIYTQKSADTTSFDVAEEFTLEMLSADSPHLVRVELSLDKKKLLDLHKNGEALPESISITEKPGTRYCRIK